MARLWPPRRWKPWPGTLVRPVSQPAEIGLPAETLRKRVRQAQADKGLRPGVPTSEELEEINAAEA